jgi:hypothetical protein
MHPLARNHVTCSYAVSAATVALQLFGKHVPTTEAEFSVRSVRRLHNMTTNIRQPGSEPVPKKSSSR